MPTRDPFSFGVPGSGNVVIANEHNKVIRKVAASTGVITTYGNLYIYGRLH